MTKKPKKTKPMFAWALIKKYDNKIEVGLCSSRLLIYRTKAQAMYQKHQWQRVAKVKIIEQ